MAQADHAESNPGAPHPLIHRMSCSLAGQSGTVIITPGSLAQRAYGQDRIRERYQCSFGLNPAYQERLEQGGLKFTGLDPEGQARLAELPDHPFFLASLFLPQMSSRPGAAHALIKAFLEAASKMDKRRELDE